MPVKTVLCDIEGTTTSIAFAKDVLFPLSYREMERFIRQNWSEDSLARDIIAVKEELAKDAGRAIDEISPDEVIGTLQSWIQEDRKVTSLKSIQGKIWKHSFEQGKIRGHVYADVPASFKKWASRGVHIDIFSSGSVEAQKLVFKYSEAGDLTSHISHYFDTTTGPKKESASYRTIANYHSQPPAEILFLSDVAEELDAAEESGLSVLHVVRAGTAKSRHRVITSFDQIEI